ncbi:hypothetical protein RDI58_007522 [Solanum bulbocastanum]|uniref:Uncharacterized protein n=1 Tax=Solanum bulbocastanum TaxID=147425 RepID=A0AAN8TV82_SOLBU
MSFPKKDGTEKKNTKISPLPGIEPGTRENSEERATT